MSDKKCCYVWSFIFRHALDELGKLDPTDDQSRAVCAEGLRAVVLMLCPIVPHVCHHLWPALGGEGDVINAGWPVVDTALLTKSMVEVAVQINGKLRGTISIAPEASESDVLQEAKKLSGVQTALEDKTLLRVIYVPGRILNLVV